MFCYSNNGYTMRAVDDNYIAQEGEALFSDYATTEQLNTSFPLYNSGIPVLTLDQKLDEVDEKYKPKLDMYKDLIMSAIAADGPTQSTKIASFSAKYNAILGQKSEEIEQLYESEGLI